MTAITERPDGAPEGETMLAERRRYDANRAPEEIEEDIARTRGHLAATIDALERKLAPRHLIEKTADGLLGSIDPETEQMMMRLRNNPLPLLLIAAGVAWLFLSSRQNRQVRDVPGAVPGGGSRPLPAILPAAVDEGRERARTRADAPPPVADIFDHKSAENEPLLPSVHVEEANS